MPNLLNLWQQPPVDSDQGQSSQALALTNRWHVASAIVDRNCQLLPSIRAYPNTQHMWIQNILMPRCSVKKDKYKLGIRLNHE